MPLLRSGSAKSTLSMIHRKATKYQKFLNLSNVFLLITSTILIFSAVILMKFYHIDKLNFWSTYFVVAPYLMIILGVYTFLVCVFGFLIAGSENRLLIAIYAALLGVAFIAQLVSIFTALELRTVVAHDVGATPVVEDLDHYGIDSGITSKWDDLQTDLGCCGGNSFLIGYRDYQPTPIGRNNSVPDTCCHTVTQGCGKDVFTMSEEKIKNTIFVSGCVSLLKRKLENDVIPMMIVYACVGVLLAIVELITIVLACAFIAQISRKIQREEKMWRNTRDPNDGGDVTDALRGEHETMC